MVAVVAQQLLCPILPVKLKLPFELAKHADVISAIGVALALVQETVERQIVKPSQDDILKLRQQAYLAVHEMGADRTRLYKCLLKSTLKLMLCVPLLLVRHR